MKHLEAESPASRTGKATGWGAGSVPAVTFCAQAPELHRGCIARERRRLTEGSR